MSKRGLVLTSRPHVSAHLHQWFDRRIDILGFTKEDRQNYISSSLKQRTEDISRLIKYLDSHLTISSLCFIPFNMTMLLWLYKQGVVLPNSCTELYNYFICHTIRHHLAKHDVVPNGNILDLNDFEQPYKNVIQQLAILSYEALDKNQMTFSLDEVKAVCPQIDKIPGAINCFGLLQAVEYACIMKMTMMSFVHFSLQEFLAAYHVTCLPYDDELSVLKEKFMSDIHSNMFAVYVGMSKGKRPAFKEYLRYGSSDGSSPSDKYITGPPFKRQRIDSGASGGSSLEGSDIAISTEILRNKNMCLRLFKCFHEAGDKDLCSKFVKAGCFNDSVGEDSARVYIDLLSPCDAECLGLVLTSKQEWKKLSVILSDTAIEILHHSLPTNTPTIQYIALLGGYSINKSTSYFIVNIALMCITTVLSVYSVTPEFMCLKNKLKGLMIEVKVEDPTTLATFLHENDFLTVLILFIHRPKDLYEQSLQTIANSLKHNSTLKKLRISSHSLSEEQCCMISQRVEVVKWKVKGRHITPNKNVYLIIDF